MGAKPLKQEGPDWSAWREEFPGLRKSVYLNTVSLGQLSRRSRAAVNRFLDLWTERGASAWYDFWLAEVAGLRQEFARLVGASPEEVAVLPNISSALAAISSSLDYSSRKRVVACELDFPTLTHHFLARRAEGLELTILPSPDKISVPLEAFERAIDERTALVATCRVYFTSGYIQDVKALAEMAHRQGALCLVDDYQGTGQVPIDVKEAGVDFLLTGGLKWLIGGPGVAYLYVRRELIPGLSPRVAGWFGHNRQFDFDPHTLEFRPDARRFEAGTPAVAAVYAARAGLEIINEIGPPQLRQRTAALSQDLVARLQTGGYRLRIPADPDRQAGITILEIDEPMAVTRALADRGIIVDKRPGAVRISPYFYNTPEENEIFVNALAEITAQGR
ncbi:MAG TPA: aminotransferase class V-fold PLP-dependent enzyme [Anaerolineales bacterium]|nr:aminotransferase class V-fold PLP-dependent enzyme [Anaerolineales bacterium]